MGSKCKIAWVERNKNSNNVLFIRSNGEIMARETLDHKKNKGSTLFWFIIGLIPIANFYLLWKAAESVSGHEKSVKKFDFLKHKRINGSTTPLFILFLVPFILIPISVILSIKAFSLNPLMFGLVKLVLILVGIIAILFVAWKIAEVISGHEKIYKKYELLEHKKKKDDTIKWFVIGLIPILNLYLYWKVAEVVSGHEKIYI